MSVVEDIYKSNESRPEELSDMRKRPVLSLRESIHRKSKAGKLGLIAEYKKRSPSGFAAQNLQSPIEYFSKIKIEKIAGFSVLTEPTRFGGSWDDLTESQSFNVPLLAKDFFDTENMIHDAYLRGADSVLLIADFLSREKLVALSAKADKLGMEVLIEFHELNSADKIPEAENILVGYNRRDLRTMKMEAREAKASAMFDKKKVPFILESGINSANAASIDFSSFSGLLIGSSIITGDSVVDVLSGRGLI